MGRVGPANPLTSGISVQACLLSSHGSLGRGAALLVFPCHPGGILGPGDLTGLRMSH